MTGFAGTTLSRKGWAELIAEEAKALGLHMTPRQLAEGLGVREAEGFTASGAHIGPWEESSAFAGGSTAGRLNYRTSTRAALENWHGNGNSWWTAWGNYEKGETEGAGPTRYKRHLGVATAALRGVGSGPTPAESHPGNPARPAQTPSTSTEGGGIFGEAKHFALVAVLVLGGAAMIGMGTKRVFGGAG